MLKLSAMSTKTDQSCDMLNDCLSIIVRKMDMLVFNVCENISKPKLVNATV